MKSVTTSVVVIFLTPKYVGTAWEDQVIFLTQEMEYNCFNAIGYVHLWLVPAELVVESTPHCLASYRKPTYRSAVVV